MMSEYHHILVAVANKEMDDRIIKVAKNFLHDDVVLDIVNIIDYPDEILHMTGEALSPVENEEVVKKHCYDNAQDFLDGLANKYELSGLDNVHFHIRIGDPRHLIAKKLPEEFNSELIIMGRSNSISLENVMLGSTTKHVASKAICDTLIVN